MKKLSMILLTLLLAFGFTSAAMANGGYGTDLDPDPNRTVTYDKYKDITTIVTKKVDVYYDKKVVVKKYTDYYTEKKSKTSTETKVFVDYEKEYHPVHDWYRKIKFERTFEFYKVTTWDEVTRVDKTVTYTTPIKITKTTFTTVKREGTPEEKGKIISKYAKKYVDKEYGKTTKHVEIDKEVFKKNYESHVSKKMIKEEITKGKWNKDGDKGKGKGKGKGH